MLRKRPLGETVAGAIRRQKDEFSSGEVHYNYGSLLQGLSEQQSSQSEEGQLVRSCGNDRHRHHREPCQVNHGEVHRQRG